MIVAVVTALLRILATPAVAAEFSLLWGLEAEIKKLKDDLVVIKAVLEEAEEKKHKESSVQIWLQQVGDMAYDAVDVFDELNMEAALHPELLTEREAGVIIRSVTLEAFQSGRISISVGNTLLRILVQIQWLRMTSFYLKDEEMTLANNCGNRIPKASESPILVPMSSTFILLSDFRRKQEIDVTRLWQT